MNYVVNVGLNDTIIESIDIDSHGMTKVSAQAAGGKMNY